MKKFGDLKVLVRDNLWPGGLEADSLYEPHNREFVQAMVDLQTHVDGLQTEHRDIIRFCNTYFDTGLTVCDLPEGAEITAVYTLTDDMCRVHYTPRRDLHGLYDHVRVFAKRYSLPQAVAGLPTGVVPADSSRDKCTRSSRGFFCIRKRRLYIGPWINSNERVVIEWDGRKYDWDDADLVSDNPKLQQAVQLWVHKQHIFLYEEDKTMLPVAEKKYWDCRADLALDDDATQRATKVEEVRWPDLSYCLAGYPCGDPNVAAPTLGQPCAFISDWPQGDYTSLVESLVQSWSPEFVVTGGDNMQDPTDPNTVEDYADIFLDVPFYKSLVLADPNKNRFWPAFGNHDADATDWATFFAAVKGQRYYDIVRGHIHWFFLNSNQTEPDGTSPTSVQGKWLQTMLTLSRASWKVVVCHHAPYTNTVEKQAQTWMRWPYLDWGADLVLSGDTHNYQRFEIGGLPYIVGGWSGHEQQAATDNIDGTQFKAVGMSGALLISANCKSLVVDAITTENVRVDRLILGDTPSEMAEAETPVSLGVPFPSLGWRWRGRWEFFAGDGSWYYFSFPVVDEVVTLQINPV